MDLAKLQLLILMVMAAELIRECSGKVESMNYIPEKLQKYLTICQNTGDLSQQSGKLVFWTAINQYASRFIQDRPNMTPQQVSYFHQNLEEALFPLSTPVGGRKKRQRQRANGRRVRREIRAMSLGQRRRYFRALNALKRDTSLPPNVYDFIAQFHSGVNVDRGHFGPSFASWHRLYLWILEFFLRRHDPTVSIPYWGSDMDADMANPADSVIFSPAFFGTGVGEVNDGPFRTWSQINPANRIIRNVQADEPLYSYAGIARIVAQTRARDILMPTALPDSNFEQQHGLTHMFVSGTMNDLHTAAMDPLFFSHHCYVDQIWERFKINQRRNGIDPQSDYPFIENDPRYNELHRPNATAGFTTLGGANQWTLELGNLNAFSTVVAYERLPQCPSCANSRFLYCNNELTPPRCVSRSRTELQRTGLLNELNLNIRKKRQTNSDSHPQINYISCPRRTFLNDIDISQIGYSPMNPSQHQNSWAILPIKVVTKRQTEYNQFEKYSLHSNAQLGLKRAFMKPSVQKKFATCDRSQDSVGKIKIVSYGLNHKAYSEEYAIVDNRLGVAESIGYLPVKVPTASESSEVMIAAFDSCGRVCKPYIKQGMSGSMDSQFTGAVRVTSAHPLQYAYSYSDATLNVWDIPNETSCPTINYKDVPLSFFCDYSETWIWSSGSQQTSPTGFSGVMNPTLSIHGPSRSINIIPSANIPQSGVIRSMPGRRRSNRFRSHGRYDGRQASHGISHTGSRNVVHHIPSRTVLYPRARRQHG